MPASPDGPGGLSRGPVVPGRTRTPGGLPLSAARLLTRSSQIRTGRSVAWDRRYAGRYLRWTGGRHRSMICVPSQLLISMLVIWSSSGSGEAPRRKPKSSITGDSAISSRPPLARITLAPRTSGAARRTRNGGMPAGPRPVQVLMSCPARSGDPPAADVVVVPLQVRVTEILTQPAWSRSAWIAQRTPVDCPANTGGDPADPRVARDTPRGHLAGGPVRARCGAEFNDLTSSPVTPRPDQLRCSGATRSPPSRCATNPPRPSC